VFALLVAGPVHAATLTICPSGCDFTAIQPAIDSASSGDTIRISSGVFPGIVSITNKSLVLQGDGASQTVIERDPVNPDPPLVGLSCSQSFRITIQDLAITNPHPDHPFQVGLDNSGCKLKLKNITAAGSNGGGTGISHRGSTLSIEDSMVAGNGTGIWVGHGTGTLIRSTVIHNAYKVGGGVAIGEGGKLRIHRSIISNNGSFNGGGIINSGELMVTQSVITNNGAGGPLPSMGGGIVNSGVVTLTHSVIADNETSGDGGGIFNSGELTLNHSTVLGNKASCDKGNCQGGVAAGFSMLAVLPARA
jgi:hypothetical protein